MRATVVEADQKLEALIGENYRMSKLIVFKCPRTGLQVQTPLAHGSGDGQGEQFEAVKCLACTQIHFVNRRTGKVLGDRSS